jgi:hypothetical protein
MTATASGSSSLVAVLKRHVDDLLAVREQPRRDVPPDPAAALDRPDALRPPPGSAEP